MFELLQLDRTIKTRIDNFRVKLRTENKNASTSDIRFNFLLASLYG